MIVSSFPALAQDPFTGRNRYPQFRNISGLSGSGYGVDSEGYRSLSGPVSFSTPAAHTLGRGQVQLGGGAMSFYSSPAIASGRSNGTAFGTIGITFARWNIASTFFVKSASLDQVYNLQIQYIPEKGSNLVFSGGMQDVEGRGGSSGEGRDDDEFSSQSLFAVVTYRWDLHALANPLYLSLGCGTHRFGRVFGSLSYQIEKPLRLWIELDGYSVNMGLTGAWRLAPGRRGTEATTTIGYVRGRYFLFSVGFGF